MSEPISIAVSCWLGSATLGAYTRSRSAISAEAQAVTERVFGIVQTTEQSQMLFGGKAMTISQLRSLANDCAEPDWDENAANAIVGDVVQNAEDFVRSLPYDVPAPECAPEPDGSISLDWIQSKNRMFSLSIGSTNRLAYAWLDGTDKGHGVAHFDGISVPPRVLAGIQSIVNYANASLRIA